MPTFTGPQPAKHPRLESTLAEWVVPLADYLGARACLVSVTTDDSEPTLMQQLLHMLVSSTATRIDGGALVLGLSRSAPRPTARGG